MIRRRANVVPVAFITGFACAPAPDFSGTHFECDSANACPNNQLCTAGICGGSAVPPGPFAISLQASPSVSLAIEGDSGDEQASVVLSDDAGSAVQRWSFQPITGTDYGDGYHIVSLTSQLCLDLDSRSLDNGLYMQQIRCQLEDDLTQIFQFLPIGSAYQIQNAYTGNCIDAGPDLSTGARPEQWDCTASYPHQLWSLGPTGSDAND